VNAISKKDRERAQRCLNCTPCRHAKTKQRGFFFWLVKRIERRLCPFCRAYEKVYGRKAHEPLAVETSAESEQTKTAARCP